jgi:hypothetical protein
MSESQQDGRRRANRGGDNQVVVQRDAIPAGTLRPQAQGRRDGGGGDGDAVDPVYVANSCIVDVGFHVRQLLGRKNRHGGGGRRRRGDQVLSHSWASKWSRGGAQARYQIGIK